VKVILKSGYVLLKWYNMVVVIPHLIANTNKKQHNALDGQDGALHWRNDVVMKASLIANCFEVDSSTSCEKIFKWHFGG